MILRIGFIALNLLIVFTLASEDVAAKHDRTKRQSNYQYVNFDLPNNTNPFNQFQNFNPRPAADQFNTNSIRRFPQFPNAAPANEEPLISVLSGPNQYHPSQSVSWNPPPTILPPQQQVSNSRTSALSRSIEPNQGQFARIQPDPETSPVAPKPNFHLEDNVPNKARVNLHAGNSNLVDKPPAAVSTTPSPATTPKDGKKDDVVIYYYYYYDDDKNKTDKEGLDTIPSLEGFDAPKAKPGKVIIKNEKYTPKEVEQPIIPLRVDSRVPSQNVPPQFAQPQPQPPFKLQEPPIQYTMPTTERPTTQSLRTSSLSLDNQGLISNIFRYGSSPAPPNVPITSEPRPYTPESLNNFESSKVPDTPKTLSSESNINKLPNFTPDKEIPENVFSDLNTTPMQTLSPSTIRTTMTTTTTTTTTTTPAPTTTTTTTTTTPAPVEETEPPGRRRFGHRQRPGLSAARPNPLNRIRSSTTTTTPAPSTTERTRSFTRPSAVAPQQRQNRFRKRPGFGGETNSEAAPSASSTSTTETPSRVATSPAAPRGRFGGRSRFSGGRQQATSSAPQSQTTSTTPAPASTESSNTVSTTRRAFSGRGRPQLRGGNRAPFLRGRKPNAPPAEEVTPDPSEASTPTNESSSSAAAAPAAEKPSESVTESSASSDSTPDQSATEASSTEKPQGRGRQRPLFGARPRPSLFGRRGSPAATADQ